MLLKNNTLDETTWEFGKPGWWISHVVSMGLMVYLGYVLKGSLQKN